MLRCPHCCEDKNIVSITGCWCVTCKHCKYHYVAHNKYDAGSKANLHMLTKRHSVLVFHEDDVENTLEIVQPSNSTQLTFDGDPPF